jgi:cytochrome c peroxidase
MKVLRYTLVLAALTIALVQCKKDASGDLPYKYESEVLNLPAQPFNYSNPNLPNHLVLEKNTINQKVTDHGATLGRVLFYDTKLSLNNKVACASCHLQANGFADPNKFSIGFDGGLTKRNASTIVNPVSNTSFFWDARETDIKTMVLRPVENHIEMGMDNFEALVKKLGALDYYKPLFKNAFGDEAVTSERLAESLSQFLNSMVSGSSKFDETEPGSWGIGNTSVLTQPQIRGMNIFFNQGRCANCHNPSGQGFSFEQGFADIGLDANPTDLGLGANQPGMEGMFKIPSLRNVTLTAPYMHDGRFATLEEVIEHYNSGIQKTENLSWSLRSFDGNNDEPVRMNLTAQDKSDLIAFLQTMTDEKFINDPKFSDPFKK